MLSTFEKLTKKKQELILDAAASIFAEEGYHGANIATICQKADISNGALYKYFLNKETLFLSVLDRGVDLMIREFYQEYTADTPSVHEAIHNLVKGLETFTEKYRPYVCLYANFSASTMNRFAPRVSERVEREARDFFVGLVEKGKQQGEIEMSVRSETVAYFIDSYITLYTYSLVSEYHQARFNSFFRTLKKQLTKQQKVAIVMESIELIIK
ncbi:MAG: TetR/AcrR family transcriptional regulator [Chitinophagales bacterium]